MKKYQTILLLFFLIAFQIKAQDKLRLVCNNFYNWNFVVDGDSCAGATIDIWREIASMLDVELELEPCKTLNDCFEKLKNGEADVFCALLKTSEREKFCEFIEPPFRTKLHYEFYVATSNQNTIQSYEDLKGLKIGVLNNRGLFEPFNSDTEIQKVSVKDFKEGIQMVVDNKIDAMVGTEWMVDNQIKQNGYEGLIQKSGFYYSEYHPVYLVMSKQSEFVIEIEKISNTLNELLLQGKIQKIITNYFPGFYD